MSCVFVYNIFLEAQIHHGISVPPKVLLWDFIVSFFSCPKSRASVLTSLVIH